MKETTSVSLKMCFQWYLTWDPNPNSVYTVVSTLGTTVERGFILYLLAGGNPKLLQTDVAEINDSPITFLEGGGE